MQLYAMTSAQGTACDETCLCSEHYTPAWRAKVEARTCSPLAYSDPPVAGSWTDCSLNDALACTVCGRSLEAQP